MVLPSGSLNQADRPMPVDVTTWSTVLNAPESYSSNSMPPPTSSATSVAMSEVQKRTWEWSALLLLAYAGLCR
jgi:hypothetical protein